MKKLLLLLILCYSGGWAQTPYSGVGEYALDTTGAVRPCTPPPYTHYHFMPYEGGPKAIHQYIKQHYKPVASQQSGYLTVRGFLTCHNKLIGLKHQAVDNQYQACEFDEAITTQLLNLTQQLAHWQVSHYKDDSVAEGYVSVIYKIKKGAVEYVVW